MERTWLSFQLSSGRSLDEIAAEADCDPSTVAYWANTYGLASVHRSRGQSRGGIDEPTLRLLVERGLSVREIATECGLSATSVRHWLRRYGLETQPARYARRDRPKPHEILRECRIHGWTAFRRSERSGFYRCARCGSARVTRHRRRLKETLLAEAGGACVLCGYDRYPGALHFHHLEPAAKQFQLAQRGMTRALDALREEAKKCVLLCANCHAEVEGGIAMLPVEG